MTFTFTVGKSMIGTLTTEKVTSFYNENKMINKFTFSEGWLQNFKKTSGLKRDIQMEHSYD
jgi:hypothetical protein